MRLEQDKQTEGCVSFDSILLYDRVCEGLTLCMLSDCGSVFFPICHRRNLLWWWWSRALIPLSVAECHSKSSLSSFCSLAAGSLSALLFSLVRFVELQKQEIVVSPLLLRIHCHYPNGFSIFLCYCFLELSGTLILSSLSVSFSLKVWQTRWKTSLTQH